MTNPEDDVVKDIDQLITDSLTVRQQDDYSRPYAERCEHCGGPWHGQASDWNNTGIWRVDRGIGEGCPGAYATAEQMAEWEKLKKVDPIQSVRYTTATSAVSSDILVSAAILYDWTPFDAEGLVREDLAAAGFRVIGHIIDD